MTFYTVAQINTYTVMLTSPFIIVMLTSLFIMQRLLAG